MNLEKLGNSKIKKKTKSIEGVGSEIEIDIKKIYPNPNQPRKTFDEDYIGELGDSIKEHGLRHAIEVVVRDDGYMITIGECRWRACNKIEKDLIRCSIVNADEQQILEISLVENIQRKDLTPSEIAFHIIKMWQTGKYDSKIALGKKIGKSQSYISSCLAVLKLDDSILEDLMNNKFDIGLSVLQELSTVKDSTLQVELYGKNATRKDIRDAKQNHKHDRVEVPKLKSFAFQWDDDFEDIVKAIKECGECKIIVTEIS